MQNVWDPKNGVHKNSNSVNSNSDKKISNIISQNFINVKKKACNFSSFLMKVFLFKFLFNFF